MQQFCRKNMRKCRMFLQNVHAASFVSFLWRQMHTFFVADVLPPWPWKDGILACHVFHVFQHSPLWRGRLEVEDRGTTWVPYQGQYGVKTGIWDPWSGLVKKSATNLFGRTINNFNFFLTQFVFNVEKTNVNVTSSTATVLDFFPCFNSLMADSLSW